ncbi:MULTISPECIES: hypothetical protein [unclassified Phycicoccus]|nr:MULTISPECIES: hypothetical protein [unclassified Phycicoccus]
MTERRPEDDQLARGLACGLWAGLVAVVVILVIVALAFFGLGLRG